MDIKEVMRSAIQDGIVPEFDKLRLENAEIRSTLQLTNKRLDDIQQQLVDQSRRIDETNQRIDKVHDDLLARIDETNRRIDKVHDDLLTRIDKIHDDLLARIDVTNQRIDATNHLIIDTNGRLNRLYEVVVRREEHMLLTTRVAELERNLRAIEQRLEQRLAA